MIGNFHMKSRIKQRNDKKRWWYIYVIKLELIQGRSKFYGLDNIYYTGITTSIGRRMGDYLKGRGYGFVNRLWNNATKKPVYIEYFFGYEFQTILREKQIKKMTRPRKEKLIESSTNMMVGYKPTKHLIVRDKQYMGEEVIPII